MHKLDSEAEEIGLPSVAILISEKLEMEALQVQMHLLPSDAVD